MKIEHIVEGARIKPYRSVADALAAGLGHHLLDGPSNRIFSALHLERPTDADQEIAEILNERPWIGEPYERTLALVSLEREMSIHEFYLELAELGYHPANVSEGMWYVQTPAVRELNIDAILHLGTFIHDRKFIEKKILTRKNGDIELIPFYHATKLKPYYHIVVVKEEKKK